MKVLMTKMIDPPENNLIKNSSQYFGIFKGKERISLRRGGRFITLL